MVMIPGPLTAFLGIWNFDNLVLTEIPGGTTASFPEHGTSLVQELGKAIPVFLKGSVASEFL